MKPVRLKLRPGLRWTGKLTVLGLDARGYLVAFDAEDPKADPQERFVYDRTVLTAQQLRDWTGWTER